MACLAGCGRPTPKGTSGASSATSIETLAQTLGLDAGEFEEFEGRPPQAGDLKAEVDHFTTMNACIRERGSLDPILGDALEAIGYDAFARDACRVIDATKANDESRCKTIDSSTLAERCQTSVAQFSATPEKCPWQIQSRPILGRAPSCLAVSARDARLCAAVKDPVDRATCGATITHDESLCVNLPTRTEQLRCARTAARWKTVIPSSPLATPLVAAGTLHLDLIGSNDPASSVNRATDVDLAPDLEHGVVLFMQFDGVHFRIGPVIDEGLDFIAPPPNARPSLALELLALPEFQKSIPTLQIPHAELLIPGRPPMETTGGSRSKLSAKLEQFVPKRGGAVAFVVDGDVETSNSTWHIHLRATTYVRDVIRYDDFAGGISALGVDGGMR